MEIILKKDVDGLGEEGDIKKVANGYARNYLIPFGYAVNASKSNIRILETQRKKIDDRKAKKREAAKSVVEKIDGLELTIISNAGENGKLFGSVTNANVADALKEKGFDVDKKKIEMPKAIKLIGDYDVKVKFHEGITADIKVIVAPAKPEEENQKESTEEQEKAENVDAVSEEKTEVVEEAKETEEENEETADVDSEK